MRLVVADDDADVGWTTVEFLRGAGHEVEAVTEADAILGALRTNRPDVLLQDARMPGLDLAAHVRSIRSDPALKGLRIILFTADYESLAAAKELGVDATIEKPFDPARLLAVLGRAGPRASG